MLNFGTRARPYWALILAPLGLLFGIFTEHQQDKKLSAFKNKSILYSRELKPGEVMTWK